MFVYAESHNTYHEKSLSAQNQPNQSEGLQYKRYHSTRNEGNSSVSFLGNFISNYCLNDELPLTAVPSWVCLATCKQTCSQDNEFCWTNHRAVISHVVVED